MSTDGNDTTEKGPKVGDRYVHAGGKLTLTVTGVGALVTWRIDGGTAPRNYNATPAEFARLAANTMKAGAKFEPAKTTED